jgi:L-ascorbate metabolism protein UlaG (beta-lactamase superfamily)
MIKPALQDDAFLADVNASRDDMSDTFRLWWLGQSGFLVQWRSLHLLIDPYLSDSLTKKYANTDKPHVRMTERVIDPRRLPQVVVTASHAHTDHLDPETLQPLCDAVPDLYFIAPAAISGLAEARLGRDVNAVVDDYDVVTFGDIRVHGIAAAHNEVERNHRGWCKFLGYVFRFGRWNIYHSGDTLRYDGLVERVERFGVDLALLPINGNKPERRVAGNLDGREAAQLATDIGAKIVIPMHYEMFEFNTADPRESFIPECERLGQAYRVLRAGERFSSDEIPGKGNA